MRMFCFTHIRRCAGLGFPEVCQRKVILHHKIAKPLSRCLLDIGKILAPETAAQCDIRPFVLLHTQEAIGPHKYLRIHDRIIVHHLYMCQAQLFLFTNSFHHTSGKSARTANIFVRNDTDHVRMRLHQTADLLMFRQCSAIVNEPIAKLHLRVFRPC